MNGFTLQGPDIGRKTNPLVLTANSRFYILRGRIQPFVIGGAGLMVADLSQPQGGGIREVTNIAVRVGGGLDFHLTESISVTGELDWVRPFGELRDLDYLVLEAGLAYRF